jgi:cytochrome c nitrite reductase small subunit
MALRRLIGGVFALRFVGRRWQMPCFALLGVLAGMAVFLVPLSRAPSYLSDEPETCINCHVMTTQYVTWQHSSHAEVATCNDCHVPHTGAMAKHAFKARDGLWHATVFTMRWEPQVIRLSDRAIPVVEENCRRCHARVIEQVAVAGHEAGDLRCWDCHRAVPHGRVRSLSAASDVFRPQLGPIGSVDSEPRIRGRSIRSKGGDRP